jgi:hypothetical protein
LTTWVHKLINYSCCKERCDAGFGVNKTGEAGYWNFAAATTNVTEGGTLKGIDAT